MDPLSALMNYFTTSALTSQIGQPAAFGPITRGSPAADNAVMGLYGDTAEAPPVPTQPTMMDFLSHITGGGAQVPASRVQASSPAPISGRQQEAQAGSSIDALLAKLAANHEKPKYSDSDLMALNFFSKLAGTKDPTFQGALGEAASTIGPLASKQNEKNSGDQDKDIQSQVAYKEYLDKLKLEQQKADAETTTAAAAMEKAKADKSFAQRLSSLRAVATANPYSTEGKAAIAELSSYGLGGVLGATGQPPAPNGQKIYNFQDALKQAK